MVRLSKQKKKIIWDCLYKMALLLHDEDLNIHRDEDLIMHFAELQKVIGYLLSLDEEIADTLKSSPEHIRKVCQASYERYIKEEAIWGRRKREPRE